MTTTASQIKASRVRGGDLVELQDGRFAIFIGLLNKKIAIVHLCPDGPGLNYLKSALRKAPQEEIKKKEPSK